MTTHVIFKIIACNKHYLFIDEEGCIEWCLDKEYVSVFDVNEAKTIAKAINSRAVSIIDFEPLSTYVIQGADEEYFRDFNPAAGIFIWSTLSSEATIFRTKEVAEKYAAALTMLYGAYKTLSVKEV